MKQRMPNCLRQGSLRLLQFESSFKAKRSCINIGDHEIPAFTEGGLWFHQFLPEIDEDKKILIIPFILSELSII